MPNDFDKEQDELLFRLAKAEGELRLLRAEAKLLNKENQNLSQQLRIAVLNELNKLGIRGDEI